MSESFAEGYIAQSERALAPIFAPLARFILRETGIPTGRSVVLDVGGGTGQLLESFLDLGFQAAILLDLEAEMVFHAKRRFASVSAGDRFRGLIAAAERIPLASGSVDLVVSRNSLHLWENLDAAWEEIARVLRPAGSVFAGRGFGPDLTEDLRKKVKADRKEIRRIFGDPDERVEPPSPDPDDLKEIALQCGLFPEKIIPDGKSFWFLARKPA